MNTIIASFVNTHVAFGNGLRASTNSIVEAYVRFNNGSTNGKLKLYTYLQGMEQVSKVRAEFIGLALKDTAQHSPNVIITAYQQQKIALKEREMAEQTRLKELKIAKREREMAEQTRLKELEMELAVELQQSNHQHAKELKKMEMAFIEKENNKNRKMYLSSGRFNKYLDLQVYGSPAKQYITNDSLVDVLGFSVYNALGDISKDRLCAITDEVDSASEEIPIVEEGATKEVRAVPITKLPEVVHQLSDERTKDTLHEFASRVETISSIATRDEHRYIATEYERKRGAQEPKLSKAKNKIEYIRSINNLHMNQSGEWVVECYCCRQTMNLKSGGCHRSHDIPQSEGGDWSKDNIYLCCATCNQTMGNSLTVHEYKATLYAKLVYDL